MALLSAILFATIQACDSGSPAGLDDPVPTYGECNLTPNYINEVDLNRWPSFPLRYYFDSASFPTEFLADYRSSITDGIRRWHELAVDELGAIIEVNAQTDSDFLVVYREITPTNSPARTFHSTGTPYLEGGEIVYNSTAMAQVEEMVRNGFSRDAFRRGLSSIAAHEMGHLMGIIGHPSRTDVLMGSSVFSQDGPTLSDMNTLIHAYCRP